MKAKSIQFLFVALVVLLVTFAATVVAVGSGLWSESSATLLSPSPSPAPPTPTTFPVPTATPLTLDLDHLVVATREQAIEAALLYDSRFAIRDRPLTKEMITADSDMIIVEAYATEQEAFAVYEMGGIPDQGPPVWVVGIKGKVSVKVPGLAGMHGPRECDGVTYFISQVDGGLLGFWGGIRRSEQLP